MTETIDQLIRTRFDAVTNPIDDGNWNDVLARARSASPIAPNASPRRIAFSRPLPRRFVLGAAVAALAAVVTAVAFGWPQTFIDFLTSPPAPQRIKDFFGAQNVGTPVGMNPKAVPGQARKIVSEHFDVTGKHPDHPARHTLYVAPRKGGGFCYVWSNYGGSCADAKRNTSHARTHPAARAVGIEWLANDFALLASGWVRTAAVKSVEARFTDGTTASVPITWVSAPISAGFFVYPVPLAHQTRADALASVVALDAGGKVVGRQDFRLTKPLDEDVMQTLPDGTKYPLPRRADAARARKIISFRTTTGSQGYVWVMPRAGGGLCFLSNRAEGCTSPYWLARLPVFNGGLSGSTNPPLLFFGQAKPKVATIELRYQNGESERLTPVDGFVLTEIKPTHYKLGTRLLTAVALDRSGKAIYSQRYQPKDVGVYPCETTTNLGYRVKACP